MVTLQMIVQERGGGLEWAGLRGCWEGDFWLCSSSGFDTRADKKDTV